LARNEEERSLRRSEVASGTAVHVAVGLELAWFTRNTDPGIGKPRYRRLRHDSVIISV